VTTTTGGYTVNDLYRTTLKNFDLSKRYMISKLKEIETAKNKYMKQTDNLIGDNNNYNLLPNYDDESYICHLGEDFHRNAAIKFEDFLQNLHDNTMSDVRTQRSSDTFFTLPNKTFADLQKPKNIGAIQYTDENEMDNEGSHVFEYKTLDAVFKQHFTIPKRYIELALYAQDFQSMMNFTNNLHFLRSHVTENNSFWWNV
jgi:hypothetical protein